jgi:hypothetical protein
MNLLTSRPQTHQTSFEFLSDNSRSYIFQFLYLEATVYSFILRSPNDKGVLLGFTCRLMLSLLFLLASCPPKQ